MSGRDGFVTNKRKKLLINMLTMSTEEKQAPYAPQLLWWEQRRSSSLGGKVLGFDSHTWQMRKRKARLGG